MWHHLQFPCVPKVLSTQSPELQRGLQYSYLPISMLSPSALPLLSCSGLHPLL